MGMSSLLSLPTVNAPKGSLMYPRVFIPTWLDSDPYNRWSRPKEEPTTDHLLVAAGGFCAPSGFLFGFFGEPTDQDHFNTWLRVRQMELREHKWDRRAKRWWRAHWWPAVIRDLREEIAFDREYD